MERKNVMVSEFEHLMTGASVDAAAIYARCRAAPVFRSERVGGWVLTRYSDVRRVLRDEQRFPPLESGPGTTAVYGRTVLQMTGDEHRRKVAPLARRLRNPRLLEDEIRLVAATALREMLETIDFAAPVELRGQLFSRFPMTVIARLMGIEEASRFRDLYGHVVAAATSNMQGDPDIAARGTVARKSVYEMLTPEVAHRRRSPGDDLLSEVCSMTVDGRPLPDDEVLAYALFLFVAGVETTERTLTSAVHLFATRPDLWTLMGADRTLVLPALAETLRFCPPVHGLTRGTACDVEFDGVAVPAGSRVLAVIGAANRDPAAFDAPDDFVLDRFAAAPHREFTAASDSLAFGTGLHQCTGSLLARVEMELVLDALLDRYPALRFADQPADERGFVLRAPSAVTVINQAPMIGLASA